MSQKNSTQIVRSHPTFLDMLAILFIALKLTNVITWPWWVVLAPIWIPLSITACLLLVAGILVLIAKAGK